MTRSACLSFDLDGLDCYTGIFGLAGHDDERDDPILTIGLDRLLEFLSDEAVLGTLFCIGATLRQTRTATTLRLAADDGHELASHSYSHYYDLRTRGRETIDQELAQTEELIESVCGTRPVGFRTPGYNIAPSIAHLLAVRGYRYDSSIFPCPSYWLAKGLAMAGMRAVGKRSQSQMTPISTLTAPTTPYRFAPVSPWRAAKSGALWQLPIAVDTLRLPIYGTSLHLLGGRGFALASPWLTRNHPAFFNLEFHAIDFVDQRDAPVLEHLAKFQRDLQIPITDKLTTYRRVVSILRDSYDLLPLRDAVDRLE